MAKATDDQSRGAMDTSQFAKTVSTGSYDGKGDIRYIPGEGFFFSTHEARDQERECDKRSERLGKKKYGYCEGPYKSFLSESEITHFHNVMVTQRKLDEAKSFRENERAAYEAACYPGTDTQDPTKTTSKILDKRNEFDLDRSRSSILLTCPQGHRYMNGSTVEQHKFVALRVNSPDGRPIVELAMTFDQFASMLVSNMETPCTIDEYWSITDDCVRLQEVVKPPETVSKRMLQRLDDRLGEMKDRLATTISEVEEQISTGKAMSKTKLVGLLQSLNVYRDHFDSNRNFTVEQAEEEVASIVERAAISVAWEHRLSAAELQTNSTVRTLVASIAKPKELPEAPKS